MQVMFNSRDAPRHASHQASSPGAKWCAGHSKFWPPDPEARTIGEPTVIKGELSWSLGLADPMSCGCQLPAQRSAVPRYSVDAPRAARRRPRGPAYTRPGEEVEGLAELTTVIESPSHGREIFDSGSDVVGALFEDLAALVVRQVPPSRGFSDRDQGRARGRWAAKALSAPL